MKFEILDEIRGIETIAVGRGGRSGDTLVRSARYWQAMDQDQAAGSQNMSNEKHFVVCIRNDEYKGSLELRKIYEVLADSDAASHDLVRIVDESGEDYLYPRSWFLPIELPQKVEEKS